MFQRLALVAAALIGSLSISLADEPAAATTRREPVEVLEAQLEIKKATLEAATLDVRKSRLALERATKARTAGTGSAEELDKARLELDMTTAQVDVRKAELREAEARLKVAKEPPAAGKGGDAEPKIAVFNMAAVMRDFNKAKYEVYILNQKRLDASSRLVQLRDDHIKTQNLFNATTNPNEKDMLGKQLRTVAFDIQEEDAKINKMLNDKASLIISSLYDEIQSVVNEMAEENGYQIVFAYPDAVTREDKANPQLKELKLKPPAAQPFFVAKKVDITAEVLEKLNAKYPPLDSKGKKVDMSKLPGLPGNPPAVNGKP